MINDLQDKARIGLARKVARKLLKDVGINNPPVVLNDVVKTLKQTIDLTVRSWAFGENIDGIQITQGTCITIGYNSKAHPHRQRFTVAHEIGHILLSHTVITPGFDLKSNRVDEIEANQFAAELLMPLGVFKNDYAKNQNSVDTLASLYNVSLEAAWWRIYDCGLFKS